MDKPYGNTQKAKFERRIMGIFVQVQMLAGIGAPVTHVHVDMY